MLNSKQCLVGFCGWQLSKDFLQLALQEQEAESKDTIPVSQKPKVQMQSQVPAMLQLLCAGWSLLGSSLLSPLSFFRRSRLWGRSVLQESILADCEGFIFHSQAAAAQGPGGSCSSECSYTGQVLLPESHFLPSPIALITARLKL